MSLKASDHEHLKLANDEGKAAVEKASVSIAIPAEVKAALRGYVHPLVSSIFNLVKLGVDAALGKIPIAGGMIASIVNPIIDKLEPAVETKLSALLA